MTISTELKLLSIPAVISLGIIFYPLGEAEAATLSSEPQPFDLRTWIHAGNPNNGEWVVSPDGTSVLQKINDGLTFFVSPDEFIDTTINGKFKVLPNNDNDYIGFVFGYQSPIAANNDGVNDMDFMLFDWMKKSGKNSRGFRLAKVDGTIDPKKNKVFWGHQSTPEFNLLATDFGDDKGWKKEIEYDFTLLYETDRIKIDIDNNTIFDISADEVGGEFQPGHFGFYNLSQPKVNYSGFTHQDIPFIPPITPIPPAPPITPTPSTPPETERVPEPSSVLGLLAFGAVGLAGLKRKKQQKA